MVRILIYSTLVFTAAAEKGAVKGSIMKNTGEMVRSSCLPKLSSRDLKTKDFEITESKNAFALDENYKKAVLQAMTYLTQIVDDKSLFAKPIKVEQHRGGRGGKRCFNYSPGGRRILLVSGCTKSGDSPYEYAVKHFIHEMGHLIGQQNGNYAAYFRKVPKPCHISSYGINNDNPNKRNEEFADVFRGVVFDSDRLRAAGGSCVAAADFFRDLLKLKTSRCK